MRSPLFFAKKLGLKKHVFFILFQLFYLQFSYAGLLDGTDNTNGCNPCENSSKNQISCQVTNLQEVSEVTYCTAQYQRNNCEDFKRQLSPEDQGKVINCSSKKGNLPRQVLLSCGSGITDYVLDTINDAVQLLSQAPTAVLESLKKTGVFLEKCNNDSKFRSSLFESVAPLYSSAERATILNEVPCEGLISTIRQRQQSALDEIAQKKNQQKRIREHFPDRQIPEHIRLTTGEELFQAKYYAAADEQNKKINATANAVWSEVKSKFACYSLEARIEVACAILIDTALEIATGGATGAIFKSTKVQKTLAKIETTQKSLKSKSPKTTFDVLNQIRMDETKTGRDWFVTPSRNDTKISRVSRPLQVQIPSLQRPRLLD